MKKKQAINFALASAAMAMVPTALVIAGNDAPVENTADQSPAASTILPRNPDIVRPPFDPARVDGDDVYSLQWHMHGRHKSGARADYFLNAERLWADGYTGRGCRVGVFEISRFGAHAEIVRSLIDAAADDQNDGVGIAPGSTLTVLQKDDKSMMRGGEFDVTNHSWDYTDLFSGSGANDFTAALQGRDGLGTIVFKAAGNSQTSPVPGYSESAAARNVILVGNADHRAHIAAASRRGPSTMVAAPGTDIPRTRSNFMSGTSLSSPLSAGIACMVLRASDNVLGYRDVQQIFAAATIEPKQTEKDAALAPRGTNAARVWNGGGYSVGNDAGFGLVDARAVIRLAETWAVGARPFTAKTAGNEIVKSYASDGGIAADPLHGGGNSSITVPRDDSINVEWISVRMTGLNFRPVKGKHSRIVLTSPAGTRVIMMSTTDSDPTKWNHDKNNVTKNADGTVTVNFTRATPHFLNERTAGEWALSIEDDTGGSSASLASWSMTATGSPITRDTTYIITEQFADRARQDRSRTQIRDRDGGNDTLNAATIPTSSYIDLSGRALSLINSTPVRLSRETIENALAGDGDDTLIGSVRNNVLHGGRGNDTLVGTGGVNTYMMSERDGHDTIVPSWRGRDRVIFSRSVKPDSVQVTTTPTSVRVTFAQGAASITLSPRDAARLWIQFGDDAKGAKPVSRMAREAIPAP